MTRTDTLRLLVASLLALVAGARAQGTNGLMGSPAATPVLGRVKVFDDWAVGCDNLLQCTAVSLAPADSSDHEAVLMTIARTGGPLGQSSFHLMSAIPLAGKIDILVDGLPVTQLTATPDSTGFIGLPAFKLIRMLGSSYAVELRQKGAVLGAPSLAGLAMALRYIDEQQGRVGSINALAAIGDGPADQSKALPPPATVAIRMNGPGRNGALTLTPDEELAARRLAVCDGRLRDNYPIEVHGLDRDHALVLLPCDAGAENVSSVPLIASGKPGEWTFQVARFDHQPGASGPPGTPPLIVNPQWQAASGELVSFAKGRPQGDCGTSERYLWDGAAFRLDEARAMPVCRGAWIWPVIWTATPVDAAPSAPVSAGTMPSP